MRLLSTISWNGTVRAWQHSCLNFCVVFLYMNMTLGVQGVAFNHSTKRRWKESWRQSYISQSYIIYYYLGITSEIRWGSCLVIYSICISTFFVIVCLNFEHCVSGAKVGAFMNHSRKRRRGVDIIWLEVEGSFDPHSQGRQGHPSQGKKGRLTLVEKGTLDVQTNIR